MTRDELASLKSALLALGLNFRQEITPELIPVWERGLRGLSASQISRATDEALRRCKRFPNTAEFRELAGATGGGQVNTGQRALLAWQTVRRAIREQGSYSSVYFEDPLTNATIRQQVGGWIQLCGKDSEELEWVGKEFVRTYEALSVRGIDEHAGRHLPGLHEVDHREGWPLEPPVRVAIGPAPAPPVRRALPPVAAEVSPEEAEKARRLVRELAEASRARVLDIAAGRGES